MGRRKGLDGTFDIQSSTQNLIASLSQKLTNKTFNKLTPGLDGGKKHKPPSMSKLLKARLQKVVDKKDAT
jgi:hypothetical protein